ncbi:MAG: hypothetical protein J6X93_01295 [Bacilli bacterium]|nr:hypothetical protein [Bacilli bacterium]
MRKARIINILILLFVITSCFMLCGCSLVGENGKLEFYVYSKKKTEKILNDIIDNMNDINAIKTHYDLKCYFDESYSGTFDEEYIEYDNNYYSVDFHGEYRKNPDDKDTPPSKIDDYCYYYYVGNNNLIVSKFENDKYVSTYKTTVSSSFEDAEYDQLPEAMHKEDGTWKDDIKLLRAEKSEVYFRFKESIETTYVLNNRELDCIVEGDYCIYIKNSHITKVVIHSSIYFYRNPLNNIPYDECTKGIEIDGETIFEYDLNKSYDDIVEVFKKARIHSFAISCGGYLGDIFVGAFARCEVEYISNNEYKATGTAMTEKYYSFGDGVWLALSYYDNINNKHLTDYQIIVPYENTSIELADGTYYENGSYHSEHEYLYLDFECTIIINENNDVQYRDILIKVR